MIDERLKKLEIRTAFAAQSGRKLYPLCDFWKFSIHFRTNLENRERTIIQGRLGEGLTIEQGREAAKLSGLNLLAQMKAACDGDLSRVQKVIKIGGFVQSLPTTTYADIPTIINGCSDLMVEVFGESGRHARFAVSSPSLPLDVAVEIDAIIEITS